MEFILFFFHSLVQFSTFQNDWKWWKIGWYLRYQLVVIHLSTLSCLKKKPNENKNENNNKNKNVNVNVDQQYKIAIHFYPLQSFTESRKALFTHENVFFFYAIAHSGFFLEKMSIFIKNYGHSISARKLFKICPLPSR